MSGSKPGAPPRIGSEHRAEGLIEAQSFINLRNAIVNQNHLFGLLGL